MIRARLASNPRRAQIVFALALAGLLYAQFEINDDHEPVLLRGTPVVMARELAPEDRFEHLVRTDPLAALIESRARHVQTDRKYRCTFTKQELLPDGMSPEQEIDVKFRSRPYSVFMHWIRNPGLADRVIYVKDRWIDADAENASERQLAVCQPGAVARLFVKSITQPIHGPRARKASRRFIDEFGFERSLDLLIEYCERAADRNELKLVYCGDSFFDGRPTWVVRRTLPYTNEDGPYPDRIAEVHIDKEHRVPVAVYCYSDDRMRPEDLLGKYEYRNVRFDSAIGDVDFNPATYGM